MSGDAVNNISAYDHTYVNVYPQKKVNTKISEMKLFSRNFSAYGKQFVYLYLYPSN